MLQLPPLLQSRFCHCHHDDDHGEDDSEKDDDDNDNYDGDMVMMTFVNQGAVECGNSEELAAR